MSVIASIDPGFTGTGIAIWAAKTGRLLETYEVFVKRGKGQSWEERLEKYCERFVAIRDEWRKTSETIKWYCERPKFFDSVAGGMTARKGDLIKLTIIAGTFRGLAFPDAFEYVDVNDWKGQLPKEVCIKWVAKKMGYPLDKFKASHIWDAIGIGLWLQGRF